MFKSDMSPEQLNEQIAERIATLRIKKQISARDMSLSIGQSENYINNIENKNSFPSILGLYYICEYLGISLKEFFDDDIVAPVLINKLIETICKFDDEKLEPLLKIVNYMK